DHSFQVALSPGRQRREDNRANYQREEPWPGGFNFVRKKRNEQTNKTVNAHFRKRAGQDHRDAGRRGLISVREPGVKRKERHFDREAEKNSREDQPSDVADEQSVFGENRQRRK